jgi:hypothetical protein
MRSLRYFFFEFSPDHQQVLYDFGTDRVAAFSIHRQLEKQGKKLSAVQIKSGYVAESKRDMSEQLAHHS